MDNVDKKSPVNHLESRQSNSGTVIAGTQSGIAKSIEKTPFGEAFISQVKPREKYRETYKYFLEIKKQNGEVVNLECIEGVYELLVSLHNHCGGLYVSRNRSERRYLEILEKEIGSSFLSRLGHSGYYIGDISGISKEDILTAHRVKNGTEMSKEREIDVVIDGVRYKSKCSWEDKGKTTYYVEITDENGETKIVHIAKQGYELLIILCKQVGELLECEGGYRTERDQVRIAFGSQFLKTVTGKGIYIGTLLGKDDFIALSTPVGKIVEDTELHLPGLKIIFLEKKSYNSRISYDIEFFKDGASESSQGTLTQEEVNLLYKINNAQNRLLKEISKYEKGKLSGIRKQLGKDSIIWKSGIGWYIPDPSINHSKREVVTLPRKKKRKKNSIAITKRDTHIKIRELIVSNPGESFSPADIIEILELPVSSNIVSGILENIVKSDRCISGDELNGYSTR